MKFLYFGDGDNDAYAYPIDKLQTIQHDTDTSMELYFQSTKQDGDGLDKVNLTLTAGSDPNAVIKAIGFAINQTVAGQNDFVITVADNVEQEYIHSSVTDVHLTLDT